jgi:uncharacterized RDD family membrane protein YckC
MTSLPAGWYKDPADPTTQRWWDGEGWLGKAIPADATPPDGPPPADEPEPAEPVPGPPAGPAASVPPGAAAHPTGQAGPPPGWGAPPPGYPPGYQPPPPGWGPPPQGWTPPPGSAPAPGSAPPPGGTPPPGWAPPGYQPPPPGWGPPPQGWTPPQGATPPPGWTPPPPGWTPPPGWVPPHAFAYQVQARPHGRPLAGLGRRLVARLIDIVVVLILNVLVNGWLAYQWWLEVEPIFRATMADPFATPEPASARSSYLILTMLVVATALWFAYEVPALANSGQTLGKRLLQVKVVKLENTEPLGFGRAFGRWARLGMWTPLWSCYGLGFLAQLVDAGSVLFDQQLRQALHDKSAATVVVAVPPGHREQPAEAAPDHADDSTGGKR